MQKVVTPIGVVVEVDDNIYENNKNFLKKFEDTSVKTEEIEAVEKTEVEDTSVKTEEVKNTAIKKKTK